MLMATFSLQIVAAILGSPMPISIAAKTAKFQIVVSPTNIAR